MNTEGQGASCTCGEPWRTQVVHRGAGRPCIVRESGRVPSVTVRADDLTACMEEAGAHLAYWGENDPEWMDRLRAALSAPARTTSSDGGPADA